MLPQRKVTAGNIRRFFVDYSQWLNSGVIKDDFAAVSSSVTATVTGVDMLPSGLCVFFIEATESGEEFTITLTLTTNVGEVKVDVVPFLVVDP